MAFKSAIIKSAMSARIRSIDRFRRHPLEVQAEVFRSLMVDGARTKFGVEHHIAPNISMEELATKVELYDYEQFKPYIERMMQGEADVAALGRVKMFARSSGTTSQRSKYIPISECSFKQTHMQGMQDTSVIYNDIYPKSEVLDGKVLTLGGSCYREGGNLIGDLSGLVVQRFNLVSGWFRLPKIETALLENFDEKCERICQECLTEDVRSFAGVPSWNLALMSRVLEYSSKRSLREVWPNLELFIHGGVEMAPYREAYRLIAGDDMRYMETYNASEGFFAIADDPTRSDMLLMLDYQTYYEFRDGDSVVPLEGVRMGVVYAIIITSSNGLWRYEIGDTVEFTSLDPYRIRFKGRTRQFINAFGEEVIVENSDSAVIRTCEATNAVVADYMVAPKFMDVGTQGCHQWLIEFIKRPDSIEVFTQRLDCEMRSINSDYDAKRSSTLSAPEVTTLEEGTFLRWMSENNKNKVPRLSNDRQIIEGVLEWMKSKK